MIPINLHINVHKHGILEEMILQKPCPPSEAQRHLRSKVVANQSNDYSPSLIGLSYALRHPETWPEGFAWNYNDCKSCAIGLACQLWSLSPAKEADAFVLLCLASRWFGMPFEAAQQVFFDVLPPWSWRYICDNSRRNNVSPEDVAMAIDRYGAGVHA
jgi:hypothetical protein